MEKLLVSSPVVGALELEAVKRVLQSGYLGMGSEVAAFEKDLEDYLGHNVYVACTSNGTVALQLAMQAIGIGAGDEVLVPSLTYVACFQAVSALGATPVACDVDIDSGFTDLDDARARVTSNTKALMPVHYGGNVGRLTDAYQFCRNYRLHCVEDAAHAFGSLYQGKKVGATGGDVACFSFDPIKNITCGEGGAVVSARKDIIDKVKAYRCLGLIGPASRGADQYDVEEQGWRAHMSDIMAAIGRVQLRRFDTEFRPLRKKLFEIYHDRLSKVIGVHLFDSHEVADICPQIFPIRVEAPLRSRVQEALNRNQIEFGYHYRPNHRLMKFKTSYHLPNTERLEEENLTLPLHCRMHESDVNRVCNVVEKALC